ncbi:putative xanthine dehydrogenase/oxidase [Apostichopus japonicus]|uniref:Putative xanthine dehydrogenase/oxidase n=1 Tax=Stichopus japonicus TaxID=307972 RepID=A0A2G8JLB9_STIJA|nr:putative xanthine dehydrogenase/oxidase [Apostichopus japonicus]
MGQGLHTKIIQVASRCLGVPTSKIHISEANTDKVPNTPPTAASISTDINGMAVKKACQAMKERLEPYMYANPKGNWEDWVRAAYIDRVSLSVTGFHKVEDLHYDWEKNVGRPYDYFSFGTAATEVEIDCLTGDHHVIKTHIVMDVGDSLNPAIDVGQIEGGFIQGYGMFVLEDHQITPRVI